MHHIGLCAFPMLRCGSFLAYTLHTELARRAFSIAAPSTWNFLPADIRLCESILIFKRHLKTHLFKLTSSGAALAISRKRHKGKGKGLDTCL